MSSKNSLKNFIKKKYPHFLFVLYLLSMEYLIIKYVKIYIYIYIYIF